MLESSKGHRSNGSLQHLQALFHTVGHSAISVPSKYQNRSKSISTTYRASEWLQQGFGCPRHLHMAVIEGFFDRECNDEHTGAHLLSVSSKTHTSNHRVLVRFGTPPAHDDTVR